MERLGKDLRMGYFYHPQPGWQKSTKNRVPNISCFVAIYMLLRMLVGSKTYAILSRIHVLSRFTPLKMLSQRFQGMASCFRRDLNERLHAFVEILRKGFLLSQRSQGKAFCFHRNFNAKASCFRRNLKERLHAFVEISRKGFLLSQKFQRKGFLLSLRSQGEASCFRRDFNAKGFLFSIQ